MCLDNWNFFERKKKYFYSFIILIASHILAPLGLCCEGVWPRSLPHWLPPYQWIWNSVSRLIINVHTTITQMASTRNFQIIRKIQWRHKLFLGKNFWHNMNIVASITFVVCSRVPAANAPGCTAAEGLLYKPWSLVVPTCTARCLHQRP